jgi:hypothetical protein
MSLGFGLVSLSYRDVDPGFCRVGCMAYTRNHAALA